MVKMTNEFYKKISKIGLNKRWTGEHAKVRISNALSLEKVAIHAYLCGDGWIAARKDNRGYHHYEIKVFPDDEKLAKFIVGLFKREFNITPSIVNLHNYFGVQIKNKPACLNLLSMGTFSTRDWKIPEKLDKDLLREWLRCFFDCESNVDLNNKVIALKSVNFEGLLSIQEKLNLFQIESKVYGPYQPQNPKHSKYGILLIRGKNINTYKRLINFNHPAKKEKIKHL